MQASRQREKLEQQHIQDDMIRHQLENDKDILKQEKEKLQKDLEAKAEAKKKLVLTSTKPTIKLASNGTLPDDNACVVAMKKYFPQSEWENAKLTIKLESGGNPNSISKSNDHGCFQINNGLADYGHVIYDPDVNANAGYRKWAAHGWKPWTAVKGILWSHS